MKQVRLTYLLALPCLLFLARSYITADSHLDIQREGGRGVLVSWRRWIELNMALLFLSDGDWCFLEGELWA